MLFGRERSGLENDEAALADCLVIAPVNPAASPPLNWPRRCCWWARVAQAGRRAIRWARHNYDGPAREGLYLNKSFPATRADLLAFAFFQHLETELDRGFFQTDDKRSSMIRNIRNMFERAHSPTRKSGRSGA